MADLTSCEFHINLKFLLIFDISAFIIYLWLCWVFAAMRAFSSCSEQELLSSYIVEASHCSCFSCGARPLGHVGFTSFHTWAQ